MVSSPDASGINQKLGRWPSLVILIALPEISSRLIVTGTLPRFFCSLVRSLKETKLAIAPSSERIVTVLVAHPFMASAARIKIFTEKLRFETNVNICKVDAFHEMKTIHRMMIPNPRAYDFVWLSVRLANFDLITLPQEFGEYKKSRFYSAIISGLDFSGDYRHSIQVQFG